MADGLATALDLLMAENGVSLGTRGGAGGGGAAGEEPAGDLFGDLPDAPMMVEPIPRGRGRPPGARNRSTEEWRQMLLSQYRSPLVVLLELASRKPQDLARELGLKRRVRLGGEDGFSIEEDDVHAAVSLQMQALQAALPYLHAKAPTEVQVKADGPRGLFVMGDLNVAGVVSDGLRLPGSGGVADQRVIDIASHDDEASRTDGGGRTDGRGSDETSNINGLDGGSDHANG